jgi:hypothetical protein
MGATTLVKPNGSGREVGNLTDCFAGSVLRFLNYLMKNV